MTTKNVCSFVFCILTVFTLPTLQAGRTSIKPRATPPPTHLESVVSAVTATSVTATARIVTDKGKVLSETSRAYVVTPFTEITVNGQKGTIADLKPGMAINVTIGTDPARAGRIDANGVPTEDHSKKKKK
jgi:hypothetical protein